MPACARPTCHRSSRTPRPWVLLALLLWPLLGSAQEAGFRIDSAQIKHQGELFVLDADLGLELGETVLEALRKGVPLTLELSVEIIRERPWIWDEQVAEMHQRYVLTYHHLSRRYLVIDLNGNRPEAFATPSAAIQSLSRLRGLPIMEHQLLIREHRYRARLKIELDIESLPAPLRLWAYISPGWDLTSEWYVWQLPFSND